MAMTPERLARRKARAQAEKRAAKARRPKGKPGRPPHNADSRSRNLVQVWGIMGRTQAEMAADLGINETTLRQYYAEELRAPRSKADAAVIHTSLMMATGGGNWREAVPSINMAWMRNVGFAPVRPLPPPAPGSMQVNEEGGGTQSSEPAIIYLSAVDAKL